MFDTIQIGRARDTYVTEKRDIHEHRAPTDQSVALLREMEKAARDRIIGTLELKATEFSCRAIFSEDHFSMKDRGTLRIQFTLGERLHDITVPVPANARRKELCLVLRDTLAKEIATQAISDFFLQAPW